MNRLFGPIPPSALHLVVDMQELFRSHPEWGTERATQVIPPIQRLLQARPEQAYFSRFMPPARADQANGAWQRFYRRWPGVTRDVLDPEMLEVVPELRSWAARIVDKIGYSALGNPAFRQEALSQSARCLIVSGVETDVCVLATVMEAVDAGMRVILATDALASASDECHRRALAIFGDRFDEQIELAPVDRILAAWQ